MAIYLALTERHDPDASYYYAAESRTAMLEWLDIIFATTHQLDEWDWQLRSTPFEEVAPLEYSLIDGISRLTVEPTVA